MDSQRGLFRAESMTQALGAYLSATAIGRLIGLLRNILLTWLMFDQAEFGLLAIALVAINLLNPLCSLGLNEAVARYTPLYETRGMLRGYVARASLLVCAVAAAMTYLLLEASPLLSAPLFQTLTANARFLRTPSAHSINLMQNVAWTVFTLIVYFLVLSVLKGLRMFRAISLMELLSGILFTVLAVIVVRTGHATAAAVVACYMMSMWIALICFALPAVLSIYVRPGGDTPIEGEPVVRRMLAFSVWAALAAIAWQALQNYPIWYLNRIHGAQPAAVLGAMRTITQYVSVGAVSVSTVVMTMVTKIWESEGRAPAERLLLLTFKVTTLVLLTGCVIMSLLKNQVALLFHPSYREGADTIPLLLLSFLVVGSLGFLSIHFSLVEKARFLLWPWAFGVACNVLTGFWLVRTVGGSFPHESVTWRLGRIVRPFVNCGAGSSLGAAAWAGAIAMIGALAICLVLLRVERRPVDLGSYVLLIAVGTLALPWFAMLVTIVGLWFATIRTDFVLSTQDKVFLRLKLSTAVAWLKGRTPTDQASSM